MPDRLVQLTFTATVFVAAALVFLVQPMVAKELLPLFGGSPSVWNTTVVFFQVALLAGYAIAHVSLDRLGVRRQVWVQLVLVGASIAFLPLSVAAGVDATEGMPHALRIALLLGIGVCIPYLSVTTVSPALQRWYSTLGLADSADPYHLYVASNAGSLIGLLAFPLLLEPNLTTAGQARVWTIAFAVFAVGVTTCAVIVRRRASELAPSHVADAPAPMPHVDPAAAEDADEAIGRLRALKWIGTAAIPTALMLGVTTFITTDVASAPLLWVVPLALYLISFMLTFGQRIRIGVGLASPLAVACIAGVLLVELDLLDVGELARTSLHLAAMFTAALLAHASLYADRPSAVRLTSFYLLMSIGGAVGGMFTALFAPAVFDAVYEYPLLLAPILLVRRPPRRLQVPRGGWSALASIVELALAALVLVVLLDQVSEDELVGWSTATAGLVVVVVGLAVLSLRRWGLVLVAVVAFLGISFDDISSIHAERNFFGTIRVRDLDDTHRMLHGTTLHGLQSTVPGLERIASSYYTVDGPIGDAFGELQEDKPFTNVGVVGLGTGAMLAHERLFQRFTFFEIDEAVIDVAQDPKLFTWLSESTSRLEIVEGDARLELAERAEDDDAEPFDMLVLDAYSSDTPPVHLLTADAFETYLDTLAEDGVMMVHISSRHLDLDPVVAGNAARLGLAATHRVDDGNTLEQIAAQGAGSHWIALARDEQDLESLPDADDWEPLDDGDPDDAWTDDYSDVAGTIRWLPSWLGGGG